MTNTASDSSKQAPSQLITFTVFPDRLARVKETRTLSIDDLAALLWQTKARSKKKLQLLKLATFGDVVSRKGCLRTNANMGEIYGVEVEHDAGTISFEAAMTILEEEALSAIIYTTPSHEPGQRERWRILLPLSKPYPKAERAKFVSWANGLFGGQLANESFTLSQPFYFGRVTKHYEVFVIDGTTLDRHEHLAKDAVGPREVAAGPPNGGGRGYSMEELQGLLDQVRATGDYWHNSMVAVTASLVASGWEGSEIAAFCADYCDDGADDPDLWELIDSAIGKFGFKPVPDLVKIAIRTFLDNPPAQAPRWEYTATGQIKISMANATAAMLALGYRFSEDTFHHKLFIGRDAGGADRGQLTDKQFRSLRKKIQQTFRVDFGKEHVCEAAITLAEENGFDPVAEMLDEAQSSWDGRARLDRMAVDHFNAEDTELNRAFVRKVMIAAVARVRQPGCKFDTILVMESKEGWNKSSAWRVLAGEGNFSDESIIGKDSREVMEHLADIWIHENAELAGMLKREVEMVTTFASRQEDRARPAYGRMLTTQPRHSIEVGTTNAEIYLQKQTGNRRFWPMPVLAPIDLAKLRADRLQLWGEAAHWQAQGESLVLDPELWIAAGLEQERRRVTDPWEEVLAVISHALIHDDNDTEFVFTSDLMEHVLRKHGGSLDAGSSRRLAGVMNRLGWVSGRRYEGNTQLRGYRRDKVKQPKP